MQPKKKSDTIHVVNRTRTDKVRGLVLDAHRDTEDVTEYQ